MRSAASWAGEMCINSEIVKEIQKDALRDGRLEGLRYALSLVEGRRILNRPPAYLAALEEIEIFIRASIERTENGEPMNSTAVCQEVL